MENNDPGGPSGSAVRMTGGTLANCTIVRNASAGGAVSADGGAVVLPRSIELSSVPHLASLCARPV
jgi:hypothetical protein